MLVRNKTIAISQKKSGIESAKVRMSRWHRQQEYITVLLLSGKGNEDINIRFISLDNEKMELKTKNPDVAVFLLPSVPTRHQHSADSVPLYFAGPIFF